MHFKSVMCFADSEGVVGTPGPGRPGDTSWKKGPQGNVLDEIKGCSAGRQGWGPGRCHLLREGKNPQRPGVIGVVSHVADPMTERLGSLRASKDVSSLPGEPCRALHMLSWDSCTH